MKRQLLRLWNETDGVLSFEWTLLLTLLAIGIVGGLAGARDAIIDELGDVAEAAQAFNQSFSIDPISISLDLDGVPGDDFTFTAAGSAFTEGAEDSVVIDCGRASAPTSDDGAAEFSDSDS